MKFGVIAVTLSLELSIAPACNASDTTASERQRAPYVRLAQASPDAAGATTNNLQGIGLTASHKRIIYDNIASECPLLAQSRHGLSHCTCPLLGVKQT